MAAPLAHDVRVFARLYILHDGFGRIAKRQEGRGLIGGTDELIGPSSPWERVSATTHENLIFGPIPAHAQSHPSTFRAAGMKGLLRSYLKLECEKHIQRHFEYLHELDEDIKRKSRRLGFPVPKVIKRPSYWALDERFNPFKTRASKKLELYSFTLAKKVRIGQYEPETALEHVVEKADGSDRKVSIFQLPDAALSLAVFRSLMHKNVNRLSGYAYAYRADKTAHDAVHDVAHDLQSTERIYVAEFDFSKFFDQIDHGYLTRTLDTQGFLFTREERHVIEAFMHTRYAPQATYKTAGISRTRGVPQGTSVSLFLANVACWELDRALERVGVRFGRYADDTLVWSNSYSKVVQAYDEIRRFSELAGVPINPTKSAGIHLLTRHVTGEIKTKESVDYLGYCLSQRAISMKGGRCEKVKEWIAFLAYQNLLQPLKKGIYNSTRLGQLDWDYVVALSQIRRYLYGGLNDETLRRYINGETPHLNFRGLMSYYPLISDSEQLKELDGWMVYVLRQSLRKRQRLWASHSGVVLPGPVPNWIDQIGNLKTWTSSSGQLFDLRIPSFQLINKAMQIALARSGIAAVAAAKAAYY